MPTMDDDEKAFILYSEYRGFLRQKFLKYIELRYQLAIVLIPTIVGIWGFIGVTATSDLFRGKSSAIILIVYLGIILTISLLTYWRFQVYKMYYEEFLTNVTELGSEYDERFWGLFSPTSQGMNSLFQNIKEKGGIDVYNYLISLSAEDERKIKYGFFKKFGFKLQPSAFYISDFICIIIISILGIIGWIFPFWLLPLVFEDYNFLTVPPYWNAIIIPIVVFFALVLILIICKSLYQTILTSQDIDSMRVFLEIGKNSSKREPGTE
jgi:ABC-type cobalt transport system substrate-binding protein